MARVCLTFDNGPDPVGTPRVLDTLARHDVRSTFFVLGRALATDAGLDLARRIRDAGHQLGNHTYSHETPLGRDARPDAVQRELQRTHDRLAEVWDGPRLFRPFGGGGTIGPHLLSPAAVAWLEAHAYTCVLWSSVPGDYLHPTRWVERALADCDAADDVLMVLHDAFPEATEALDGFLDALEDRGHELVESVPQRCVLMEQGVARTDLTPYLGDGANP